MSEHDPLNPQFQIDPSCPPVCPGPQRIVPDELRDIFDRPPESPTCESCFESQPRDGALRCFNEPRPIVEGVTISEARPEDAVRLLAIYAQYIDTPVTFEFKLPTLEAFTARVKDVQQTYPFLKATDTQGTIIGYAYAHRVQPRDAYQWGAELSVYVDREACGRGIGRLLYWHLLDQLLVMGVFTAYGCVVTPNPASERLHESFGFTRIGYFENAGFKNGQWRHITWFSKPLREYCQPPHGIGPRHPF